MSERSVFVIDDQNPEDIAMLQALYSRSPASVVAHLDKLKSSGSGKFMESYYVGYGHASIGDCGTTTCFIEQVSMLTAKAIQENPLYNGQEASTRYLDYAKQAVIDPYANAASAAIQARWKELYAETLAKLCAALEKATPFDPMAHKNQKIWKNALSAKAFDIARGLLPLGTTTLLSWTTSLRQARDNLRRLKNHPLKEVREVALDVFSKLAAKYPHSFKGDEMEATAKTTRDGYAALFAARNHFMTSEDAGKQFSLTEADFAHLRAGEVVARREAVDLEGLKSREGDVLRQRPLGAPLPWRLEAYGRYNFLFLLDFGSFRDIQRHRNGVCQIPLVDARYGLHPWYIQAFEDLLGQGESARLQRAVAMQIDAVKALPAAGIATSPFEDQYLYPMGLMALVHASYSVPQTVYVGELRSGKTVHGSLRPIAQKMLNVLEKDIPGIALYGDMDDDVLTMRRGEQTIFYKG